MAYDQRPELQEQLLRNMAESRHWHVMQVYTDRMSGSESNRPSLQRLMADARKHRFDVVVVWRFDRWSRSVLDFLNLTEQLQAFGIDFVSHEQSLDTTTAMGKFTLTIFGALAELERSVIRERVASGLAYARKFGTKSGRPIGRPKVVFDRAEVVSLRESGLSWRTIASKLHVGVGTARRAYALALASPVAKTDFAVLQRP